MKKFVTQVATTLTVAGFVFFSGGCATVHDKTNSCIQVSHYASSVMGQGLKGITSSTTLEKKARENGYESGVFSRYRAYEIEAVDRVQYMRLKNGSRCE